MSKIWDVLQLGIQKLKDANQNEEVAFWIFEKYIKCNHDIRLWLFQNKDEICDFKNSYFNDLDAYLHGKPLARILHKSLFYHLEFQVFDNVFCPRNETEILVECVLDWLTKNPHATNVCDIGVGSGVIAISIAKNLSHLKVYGNDINPDAILCTYQNAVNHQCHLNLMVGSNLTPYIHNDIKINCLIANPPYISTDEPIANSVIENDPYEALFANNHGLASYQEIISQAPKVLIKPYALFFEIGYQQADAIKALLLDAGYQLNQIEVIQDYQNKDRVIKVVSHV